MINPKILQHIIEKNTVLTEPYVNTLSNLLDLFLFFHVTI